VFVETVRKAAVGLALSGVCVVAVPASVSSHPAHCGATGTFANYEARAWITTEASGTTCYVKAAVLCGGSWAFASTWSPKGSVSKKVCPSWTGSATQGGYSYGH
jgi:hypothetical protein